jgi:putative DNA primase/helicase
MTSHYEWRGAGQVVSPADSEATRKRLFGFWHHCEPAKGTPAAAYLKRRGLDWLIPHEDVRFRPECSHPTGARLPAMIWQVRNAAGSVTCLHRTFLTWEGQRADADPPKATWGSFSGAAIRLHPACHEMLVGEGVETTASAATILGIPGWAGIACGNLRSRMALPDTVRSVTIAVDHDPPGVRAAKGAAARWRREGRTVHLALPDSAGRDFNDILLERAHA